MEWLHKLAHILNEMSGFFLALIALSVASCAKSLESIRDDVKCLHEDVDMRYSFHEQHAARSQYGGK